MKPSRTKFCLFAVFPLLLCAIWLESAAAAVAPQIEPLGRIGGFRNAARIALDAAGSLYVSDVRAQRVDKFDAYGEKVATFSGFPIAGGIAVLPDGSRLFAAGTTTVSIVDGRSGSVIGNLGAAGTFQDALEVDVDPFGFVFIGDAGSLSIKVFDPQGSHQFSFAGRGLTAGKIGRLDALAIHPGRREIYIGDNNISNSLTPKVHVFNTENGAFQRNIPGANGFGSTPLYAFSGIDFDESDRGYFLDETKSRIVVMGMPLSASSPLTFLSAYAQAGTGPGQILSPKDIEFDPVTSRLFVLCGDNRIEIFGIDGGANPIRVNNAPESPVLFSPVGGSETDSLRPDLVFTNAVDPDGDRLVYNLRVLSGEDVVADIFEHPEGIGKTTVQTTVDLLENATYAWMAQAADGQAFSPWTPAEKFHVNAVEEAPAAPRLLAPMHGEALDGHGLLAWEPALDPDPFDQVNYRLEISADPDFGATVAEKFLADQSVRLADCTGYPALEDGTTYFWRVRTIDNHGLESVAEEVGSFLYDTTILKITANVAGARVYLHGNPGFAGQQIGQAPVELRDVEPGFYRVRVEMAGLESYLTQASLSERENATIYAELRPGLAPALTNVLPLVTTAGEKIAVSYGAAPFLVDFDRDGILDLLVGGGDGSLFFFRGVASDHGTLTYEPGRSLGLFAPGSTPFLADWNNDGLQDLILSSGNGTISLYPGTGAGFSEGTYLTTDGVPIQMDSAASAAIADLNDDGIKDLVVGTANGKAWLFLGSGSDDSPRLEAASLLADLPPSASLALVDWNCDGRLDLLVEVDASVYLLSQKQDGVFERLGPESEPLLAFGAKGSAKKKVSEGEPAELRLFGFDVDGVRGKDLVVAVSGELVAAYSKGKDYLPAFQGAVLIKLSQIEALMEQEAAAVDLTELRAALEAGDYKAAERHCRTVLRKLASNDELAAALMELQRLLD